MKRKSIIRAVAGGVAALAMATTVSTPTAWATGDRSLPDVAQLDAQIFATFNQPTLEQAAARSGIPKDVKQALVRVKSGKVSARDRTLLTSKQQYTQLADAISQRMTTGQRITDDDGGDEQLSAALTTTTYCRGFAGWVDSKSVISGAWLYQWAQRLDVCYNGSVVTTLNSRYHTVSHRDWAWKDQGLVSDSPGTLGGWQYQSYMRGHMEMCVLKIGCTTDQYPWVKIIAYGNGTASISSGK